MRRIIVGLLFALFLSLSLAQGKALAEECIKTVNAGAATVQTQLYEQQCALISFSSGLITKDYTFNCCGPSVFVRVNGNDWENMRQQGKLDGLKYEFVTVNDKTYTLTFRKMVNDQPQTIRGEDFFN